MTRYTITPRPKERDVLLEREGAPTLLVVRREGLDMDALEAEARRIAALLDGCAEAVIAVLREGVYIECEHRGRYGCGACPACRLRAAVDALDGGEHA